MRQFGTDGGDLQPQNPYAYEVTTASWNGTNTITAGPTGPAGSASNTGATGPTGPSGRDGLDGIASNTGATGPAGANGITIDYTTDVSLNYITVHGGINLGGHLLPTINDAFDIGSAEYKIRDLYVSDTSIWVGDDHKIAISDGKMKFIKRKTNEIPTGITGTTNIGVEASLDDAQEFFNSIGQPKATLQDFKVYDWVRYTKARGLPNQSANNIFNITNDFNDDEGVATQSSSGTIQQWTP